MFHGHIIRLDNAQFAQLPAISASTTAPFAGCTSLDLDLSTPHSLLDGQAVAAALAAPGRWPGLKRLHLHMHTVYRCSDEEARQADQYAGGLISSLSSLKGLRELSVMAPLGPCCQAGLRAAIDFTRLELWQTRASYMPFHLSALASLSNLRHLVLGRDVTPEPPAPRSNSSSRSDHNSSSSSSISSSCLPSSLVALDCTLSGLLAVHWLRHLAGCPGLRQLHVTYDYYCLDMRGLKVAGRAPPSVLDLAAQHTTGLTSLLVEYIVESRPTSSMFPPSRPHRHEGPKFASLAPNPSLARLTQLQQLCLWGHVQLRISCDQEWRHLGCLVLLQRLEGVDIRRAPPAGMQLRQLKELSCSVTLSVPDIGLLLAACPALLDATLQVTTEVAPRGSSSIASGNSSNSHTPAAPASAAAPWPCSSSSNICLSYGEHMTAEAAAAHFAAGAPALAQLRRLSLTWPQSSTSSPHLPHLAALTALTSLSLTGQGEGGRRGCVQEEDLVLALQPLSAALRVLCLRDLPLVTPRVVVMLQGVLSALQGFEIAECGCLTPDKSLWYRKRSNCRPEEEQLQLLKRLVRPGSSPD